MKQWKSSGEYAPFPCAVRSKTLIGLDKRGVLELRFGNIMAFALVEGRRICSASAQSA